MKSLFLVFTLLFVSLTQTPLSAQGKLLLVGGGTELDEPWGWSNTPYQWAVDQSANKKVAIIAFGESSDPEWLPNYFISLGAVKAKNFIINTSDSAASTVTYDSLMNYDVFFFKGGDQYNYYSTYKNTQITAAITDKYNTGGVIGGTSAGMAILSSVMYTAENGTLYPDQALKDVFHSNITLADDFVDLLPNYIADTHFVERGRLSRLAAFMANWYLTTNDNVGGIGVDDRTAFCIDENYMGTAYGTGAVNILHAADFSTEEGRLSTDSINTTLLLHGQSYNLISKQKTTSYTEDISANILTEDSKRIIYLAGGSALNKNQMLLNDLIAPNDSIVIVTGTSGSLANSYGDYIINTLNAQAFLIKTNVSSDSCSTALDRNLILSTSKFMFVGNDFEILISFADDHPTGKVLMKHLLEQEVEVAFIGEDTKLAGPMYVANNTGDELSAYYGELEYKEGLGLLNTTTIVPDAYDPSSSDFYENNTAAIQFGIAKHQMGYGILINDGSYVKLYPEGGKTWVKNFGDYSSLLIKNNGSMGDFASQQVNSSGNTRNVAGIDQSQLAFLSSTPFEMGSASQPSAAPQPLELIAPNNLSATLKNDEVELSWELNSSDEVSYVLERKSDNDDFTELQTIDNSVFSFSDKTIVAGKNYDYRIKAIADSRSSCYSNTASVSVVTSIPKENTGFLIYPNPVTQGILRIKGAARSLSIHNTIGEIVLRNRLQENEQNIDVSELKNGPYFIVINT
ncbi:T9SS type A sorting domain-containing protein, partial [Fulvivirga sp. RKSG066]|uniref:Type 1 glutamine amidotransferase-like domain-containing protein n=1 Tax=Fulvivirga aurantia TaxID=2529383 RepID=UPI0012BC7EAC